MIHRTGYLYLGDAKIVGATVVLSIFVFLPSKIHAHVYLCVTAAPPSPKAVVCLFEKRGGGREETFPDADL